MKNISFDNPYLLLIAIPLILILILPYFIAINKEARSKSTLASLIIHLVIVAMVTLAAGGMAMTAVMTETEVYVVADVSYSSHRNLDKIDDYISELEGKLPKNSKLGIVCFGKDHTVLTEIGGEIRSVTEAKVDDSATNISDALDYTSELFSENTLKRIVLITDGKETDSDSASGLISSIENLYAKDIDIDAIYLDNNISPDAKELQVSGVEFTEATYLNHETYASVLVESTYETKAILQLYKGGALVETKAPEIETGYNVINFTLHTNESGDFDYEVRLVPSAEDESEFNNSYSFTQSVSGKVNVLLVTSKTSDVTLVESIYGEEAVIDAYVNETDIPSTIEQLCKYDEILLSDFDVRSLDNVTSFVESLDIAVSQYGKSLVTIGDMQIQNKTDDDLKKLEAMLPVRYGNDDTDPKLYALVIDTSRSMQNAGRLRIMKEIAINLLNVIDDEDYVTVISFSGNAQVIQSQVPARQRNEVAQLINGIQPTQGTFLGLGMQTAYNYMKDLPYKDKQLMLISDGMSYSLEEDDPVETAKNMLVSGITTSTVNPMHFDASAIQTLKSIAQAGKGTYYEIANESDIMNVVFGDIADELTETVIERRSTVDIARERDNVLSDIVSLPDINGFVYSKAKASATTVLTTAYASQSNPGAVMSPPIYSYWSYGNGRVATLTTSLTGEWAEYWTNDSALTFVENIIDTNVPKEKNSNPYTLTVTYDGTFSTVEIVPATLNPYATADVKVTMPDGSVIEQTLIFNSQHYFYEFRTPTLGKYGINVIYSFDDKVYEANSFFNISYSPEYDSFTTFDSSALYTSVRNRGTVSEGVVPEISNDDKEVETYKYSFTVPLLIAAITLYVIDIIIRKLKWKDILSLFGKGRKGGTVK